MIRGLIIEGLSTSGKTSMLSALKRAHGEAANGERTLIALSETYSQVLHFDHGVLRSLSQREHIELLTRHIEYLEHMQDWVNSLGGIKRTHGVFYILERFHLNHLHAFGRGAEIQILEQRLASLNACCVLLTLSLEEVEPRFIESRGDEWKAYLMRDTLSAKETCLKFLDEQDTLRHCATQSVIPTIEFNTDDADWNEYAKQALAFFK